MPAPNRRNHGLQGLTDKIAKVRHTENLADSRDRLVASRTRQETKWAEANERLNGPRPTERLTGPTLANEGEALRLGWERVQNYDEYSKAVQSKQASPPPRQPTPKAPPPQETRPGRYALDCNDCWQEFRVHRLRPRLPLCDQCKARREEKKQRRHEEVVA